MNRARPAEKKNRQAGFTVFEAVVVVVLVAALSIVLMDVFLTHGRLFNLESANSDLEMQSRQAVDTVGRTIRVAGRVLPSQTINAQVYTTSNQVLVLEIPSIDGTGKVIAGTYDYAAFFESAGKLVFLEQANAASSRQTFQKVLTDSVGELEFSYDAENYADAASVTVGLTLSKNVSGKTKSFSRSNKFNLGNK